MSVFIDDTFTVLFSNQNHIRKDIFLNIHFKKYSLH